MRQYEKAIALWQKKNIRNDADLAEALSSQSVLFAYNSGKIENDSITYHDTREIFEHDGVTSYTGDLRTLFEIRNAKNANELLLQAFNERWPLSEELIKRFHFCITENTYDTRRWQLGERPGEYKKHDYVTGPQEIGASAEDVQEEMAELLNDLQTPIPDNKAIVAAAFFHAKFENIHPFADGNGRTGRILMNYILLLHNHPPITIHEEDRETYYKALDAWHDNTDLKPLVSFLKEQTEKTWDKQIQRDEIKQERHGWDR